MKKSTLLLPMLVTGLVLAPLAFAQKSRTPAAHHSLLPTSSVGCSHNGEPCSTSMAETNSHQGPRGQTELTRLERQQLSLARSSVKRSSRQSVHASAVRQPTSRSSPITFSYQKPRTGAQASRRTK